ncbi:MAG: DinB family protein [Gammaproteobacteria bacterium]
MHAHLLLLARYHAWTFDMLYDALLPLDDELYRADCGLFFRSIHGTLNHLLLADRVWYGRIIGEGYEVPGLDTELEHERSALENALTVQTARWAEWLENMDEAALDQPLSYTNLAGTRFENPFALVVQHVFNHGTHHRGQISAAISGYGHLGPEMDLIFYLRGAGKMLPTI